MMQYCPYFSCQIEKKELRGTILSVKPENIGNFIAGFSNLALPAATLDHIRFSSSFEV